MGPNHTQRPQFYEGQYLGAEDLQALTEYYRSGDARHAVGAHTWGIASGLHLIDKEIPGGVETYLTPGYAWDGLGRPIVVLAPYKIPAEVFKPIHYDTTIDESKGRLVKVWLRYDEVKARRPAPGFETCDGDGFSRVQETFRIEIGERSVSERQSTVSVGAVSALARDIPARLGTGPTVLYDESIAFQHFPPEGAAARWLIPLGHVRWKPNASPLSPGAFVKRESEDLTSSRRMRWAIGVVAETIRPVEDVVRIQRRGQDPAPKRWSDDLAWVEGDLRIDGKLNLCDTNAGNLKWQVDGTTASLTIGEAKATGQPDPRVTIKAGGNVGIGTTTPRGRLEVSGSPELGGTALFVPHPSKGNHVSHIHWDSTGDWYIRSASTSGKVIIQDSGGNVGIGTTQPKATLDVANLVRFGLDEGGSGAKVITFARDAADEVNAGKIAYKPTWDNGALAIVGAGELPNRRIHMYDDVIIQGNVGIGGIKPKHTCEIAGVGEMSVDLRVNGRMQTGDPKNAGGVWLDAQRTMFVGQFHTNVGFWTKQKEWNTFLITPDGKVGVGLADPQSRLHVVDNINGDEKLPSSHVATIENLSSEANADVLALKVGNTAPRDKNNFITFFGGGQAVGKIENSAGGISISSGAADFAECLPSVEEGEEIEAADIVGVYGGKITKRTHDADHVLAVSSRPLIVGCAPPKEREHLYQTVALLGQVPVKVRGPVGQGDYIVPSGLHDGTGTAVRPAEASLSDMHRIVGRAWESSNDQGVKLIKTAVGISSVTPMTAALSSLHQQREEMQHMRQELASLKSHLLHEEQSS